MHNIDICTVTKDIEKRDKVNHRSEATKSPLRERGFRGEVTYILAYACTPLPYAHYKRH